MVTVGAMNTMLRRYPGADPHPRTGTTPTCPPCHQGDCHDCTAYADTRRITRGTPARHPACTHDCVPRKAT